MKTENNEITIEVTLNGSSVSRNYKVDDLDGFPEVEYDSEVRSMLETLRNSDKPL
jgi:hypothetical protein